MLVSESILHNVNLPSNISAYKNVVQLRIQAFDVVQWAIDNLYKRSQK